MKVLELLIVAIFMLALAGWIQNIVKLCKADFEEPYKEEIIRGIGIVPPIGAIVGWFDLEG